MMNDLAAFQVALRHELASLKCPMPVPLDGATVFPRAFMGRATLVHWRRGDSSPAEWADAVRKKHGWCCEIPPGFFLLDLDRVGVLEILAPRLPAGYGLVRSSPGRFHVWLCGEAPPGNHIGKIDGQPLEVHGSGRLATLPPSLHVDYGTSYRWIRNFRGNIPIRPADLGIVLEETTAKPGHPGHSPTPASGDPLHELMDRYTGQDGRPVGQEWAYFCPRHEDSHRSLMVNDTKGVFFCHGAGCGFRGNRVTLEKLLGIKTPAQKRKSNIVEVPL